VKVGQHQKTSKECWPKVLYHTVQRQKKLADDFEENCGDRFADNDAPLTDATFGFAFP
jgi:hypothetical protein